MDTEIGTGREQCVLAAAVVGVGTFGLKHARVYANMPGVKLLAVVDRCEATAEHAAAALGCAALTDCHALVADFRVDIVTVATPATAHREIALFLLKHETDVYVEKPLATALDDADEMITAATTHSRVLQVGHQERFSVQELPPSSARDMPRSIHCVRVGPAGNRARDVSVALDLMTHDVDLVHSFVPGDITVERAFCRDDGAPGDEISARLRLKDGVPAHLFASRRAPQAERLMTIVYNDHSLIIDLLRHRYREERFEAKSIESSGNWSGLPGGPPLEAALRSFVACVRTRRAPLVGADEGRRALAVALDIDSAARRIFSPTNIAGNFADRETYRPSTQGIRFFDLHNPSPSLRHHIERRLHMIMRHLQYVDGPEVAALEARLAAYTGSSYVLATSSGTMALTIALLTERLTSTDAVFMPSYTYNATCNAVILAGATPVFVDVERETGNISAAQLRQTIQTVQEAGRLKPRAVIPVDYYGFPANYPEINAIAEAFDLIVIADAAQSFGGSQGGKKVGTLADVTATSFYPTKPLGGFGDGGALFTNDRTRFEKWRSIRMQGTNPNERGESTRTGLNGRLDSMQCAVLLAKLDVFDEDHLRRRRLAERYQRYLAGTIKMSCPPSLADNHAWSLFTVIFDTNEERETTRRTLAESGIPTRVYPCLPLHKHRAFQQYLLNGQVLSQTEWLWQRVLSLPFHPYLAEHDADLVCRGLIGTLHPLLLSGAALLHQRTIKRPLSISGIGIHTAKAASIRILPAPEDIGIVFVRTDISPAPELPAKIANVFGGHNATTLSAGANLAAKVATVEHLLAAIAGLALNNLRVEVDGPEIPILDGSAAQFVGALASAGICPQSKPQRRLVVTRQISVQMDSQRASIKPARPGSSSLTITCSLDYDHPAIPKDSYTFLLSQDAFVRDVAPARTFGFLKDAEHLRQRGLALGAAVQNTLVLDERRVVNAEGLRFHNECVRHKVLDALGDLALAGMPIIGEVTLHRPGHSLNHRLVRKLLSQPDAFVVL